jgi:osmotically-inducible protein OsmY
MRKEVRYLIFLALLMLAGLELFSGCASMTGETAGEIVDDNTITAEANAIIVKDPQTHYLKIDVETTQGNVVLTGFVNSRETDRRLVRKIGKIRGVKSVKSLLKIEEKRK